MSGPVPWMTARIGITSDFSGRPHTTLTQGPVGWPPEGGLTDADSTAAAGAGTTLGVPMCFAGSGAVPAALRECFGDASMTRVTPLRPAPTPFWEIDATLLAYAGAAPPIPTTDPK